MSRILRASAVATVAAILSMPAGADAHGPQRADAHAPIGVMGDHTHGKGEVMLSLRAMFMSMGGNWDGDDRVSSGDVLESYMVSPTDMDMSMYMAGIMLAPIDLVTLSFMVPVVQKSMDHETGTGLRFTTRSAGVGDLKLGSLWRVIHGDTHKLHFNFGLSIPTGSSDEKDQLPNSMGNNVRLPYPMQLGSGTWDLLPGATYTGRIESWSWGAQVMGVVRLGRNGNGYRWGNEFHSTVWGARRWASWVSTSLRLASAYWRDISGADSALNPAMVPTADPRLRGGQRISGLFGVNFVVPEAGGFLAGHRLGVEAGMPLWQHLDGPQLGVNWELTVGWQYLF